MSEQTNSACARLVMVDRVEELPAALKGAGLASERAVVVLVGGAGGMGEQDLHAVGDILRDALCPSSSGTPPSWSTAARTPG
jgi:hypothetical protein